MADITFRKAEERDADALREILNHFVHNTVITFRFDPYTLQDIKDKLNAAEKENMPFVVATDVSNKVMGYFSAGGFRASKRGYYPTLEISIFCRPECTGQGLGSRMISLLISIMRDPKGHPEFVPNPDEFRQVRHLVAGMAIDTNGPRDGIALKDFYQRCGFVETAHMPNIGYKFDRWIDVCFMQYSLF